MIVLFLIMVYSYKLVLVIKHYIAPVLYAKLVFFLHNSPDKIRYFRAEMQICTENATRLYGK